MGGIKSPSRGIEKADAAYGGDVSRLLDVCRESIIFETIEDMAACLQVGSFFDLAKLSSRPFSSLLSPCASDVEVCLATLFFQAFKDDPEVSIVRIKSSMTKSGLNPYMSTGLRFISINLRIRTPQTTKLAFSHPTPSPSRLPFTRLLFSFPSSLRVFKGWNFNR